LMVAFCSEAGVDQRVEVGCTTQPLPIKIRVAALQQRKVILLEWKLAGFITDVPYFTRTHTALYRDEASSYFIG
jgi:hypothetical protein